MPDTVLGTGVPPQSGHSSPCQDSLVRRQTSKRETATLPEGDGEHRCCDEWWAWRGKARGMLPEGRDTQAKTWAGRAGGKSMCKNLEARKPDILEAKVRQCQEGKKE